mmetsp:Transcript_36142/g.65543  ORF Transcript_36142/g.65543 Transcript_36142/m.65543 type:complete len:814 (+) Transcript_36142:34-2475(+)
MSSDDEHLTHASDLITSKPILASFGFLLGKPYHSFILLLSLIATSFWIARPYNGLKRRPVSLPPFSTSLRVTVESLQSDFNDNYLIRNDSVIFWNAAKAEVSAQSHDAIDDVRALLQKLRRERDSCKTLEWQEPLFSHSGESVALPIGIKLETIHQANECLPHVRASLRSTDLGFHGLHAALSSPDSVVEASYEDCDEKTVQHMLLSMPVLFVLLLLGVGTVPRALSPLLCLLGSVYASRAVVVGIKYFWDDLSMAAPDTQVIFVQLALCFDYSLFYWVRFSQERKHAGEGSSVQDSLMTTMRTSGLVIITSTLILTLAFAGASCYPDLNKLGYLHCTLSLTFGVAFVGFFSLTVPSVLASMFPSTFDEPAEDSMVTNTWRGASSSASKTCFRPLAAMVTSRAWSHILPVAVMICLLPLAGKLYEARPNFDLALTDFSKTVPEYTANQIWQDQFGGSKTPLTLLLEQKSHLQAGAGEKVFRDMSCRLVRSAVVLTQGTSFEIKYSDVISRWWNLDSNDCRDSPQDWSSEVLVSHDSQKEKMILASRSKNAFSSEAQEMVELFWDKIQPFMNENGQLVDLYTPLAEQILVEKRYEAWSRIILGTTVILACCILMYIFSSVFVGLKMLMTLALPIMAEYGMAVAVYEHGWLEWAGVARTGGVKWTLFYTTSGFLIALALDYDIFLFARVYEHRKQGYDNTSAVRLALEETGPVITLAGTIMVISFACVFLSPVPVISQIGFLYCFGVAMDVYIVRLLLAPATLCFLEDMNYWPGEMPKVQRSYADVNGVSRETCLKNEATSSYASCESMLMQKHE